jgi:hypothetical protein
MPPDAPLGGHCNFILSKRLLSENYLELAQQEGQSSGFVGTTLSFQLLLRACWQYTASLEARGCLRRTDSKLRRTVAE